MTELLQTPQYSQWQYCGWPKFNVSQFENCEYTFLEGILNIVIITDNILSVKQSLRLPVVAHDGSAGGHIEQDGHHQSWHEVGGGTLGTDHYTVTWGQSQTGLDLAEKRQELLSLFERFRLN